MTYKTDHSVPVVEVAPTESAAMFDQIARREMGISGGEFLARWDAGEWSEIDMDDVPGLVNTWIALPFAR